MKAREVSAILSDIATLLELKGDNPFKIRAYQQGARIVDGLGDELAGLVREGRLHEHKGLGSALCDKITELVTTGRLHYYDELRREFPATIFELLKIPGLGPKKVRLLYQTLGVRSLGELEYACLENRLLALDGFGEKSQANILDGIRLLKRHQGRFLVSDATAAADTLIAQLRAVPAVRRISVAGSLRRRNETVKDIDLLISSDAPVEVMARFVTLPQVAEIIAHGATKSSIRLADGLQADLRVVSDLEFPYALHHFTGSKEHNTALRGLAKSQGLKMNEYGLFRGEELIPCATEADIFAALGMEEIPPELRENLGEIEAARARQLPRLIVEGDLQGAFHVHTTESDGHDSLERMVTAAEALGYRYLGISDHSRSARYANGLSIERVRAQQAAIDEAQRRHPGIMLFKGIEADILPDGSLDYPDDVLDRFDFVIASVHSKFGMTEAEMTDRVVRAISHPAVTILGHPTGRLLLSRESYLLDLSRVLDAARRHAVAIELNANPHRLDLDWRFCKDARDRGVIVSINPDAHTAEGLGDLRYGVGIARKGWLTRDDVLNTRSAERIRQTWSAKRAHAGQPS
ncbi:MAG TPA: DNA polymerase/3'-5' exonuclease PolX [Nitrospiria bacterium]|nr:DNA polymerase/3'-5' exonuclease PolX [Nitrospiria bacterium]